MTRLACTVRLTNGILNVLPLRFVQYVVLTRNFFFTSSSGVLVNSGMGGLPLASIPHNPTGHLMNSGYVLLRPKTDNIARFSPISSNVLFMAFMLYGNTISCAFMNMLLGILPGSANLYGGFFFLFNSTEFK